MCGTGRSATRTRPRRSITLRNTCFMPSLNLPFGQTASRPRCQRSQRLQFVGAPRYQSHSAVPFAESAGRTAGAGKLGGRPTARPPAANLYRYFEALAHWTSAPGPGPLSRSGVSERQQIRGYRCHDTGPTATAQRGAGTHLDVLDRVLQTARSANYEGYSKHDGLNSPVLALLAGSSRLTPARRHPGGDPQPGRHPAAGRRAQGAATPRGSRCSPGPCWPGTG